MIYEHAKVFSKVTDVAIDLDGVIYPFIPVFKYYCEQRQGRELPDAKKWLFYEDWDMDELMFMDWLKEATVQHEIFNCAPPDEGVQQAWKILRNLGVKIHIVTTRPNYAWAQTVEWLDGYMLEADSLIFTHDKQVLAPYAKKGRVALLEDHVYHYQAAKFVGVYPVLRDRPWNQDLPNAVRVGSFEDFVLLVQKYNEREITWPDPTSMTTTFSQNVVNSYRNRLNSLTENGMLRMANHTTTFR